MSHFTTGVFVKAATKEDALDEMDNLLAPYDERMEVPQLLTKVAIIAERKEEIENFKSTSYAEYRNDPETYLEDIPEGRRAHAIEMMEDYWTQQFLLTDEEIYQDQLEMEYDHLEVTNDGSVITLYNPKSKWDWYVVGGRWSDIVPFKDGTFGNMGRVSDIDFGLVNSQYQESCEEWDSVMQSNKPKEAYKKQWFLKNYNSKEHYATDNASFKTFSFITPDGKWFEKGNMGWFGMSDKTSDSEQTYDENWKQAIQQHQDCYFVLVDCHI